MFCTLISLPGLINQWQIIYNNRLLWNTRTGTQLLNYLIFFKNYAKSHSITRSYRSLILCSEKTKISTHSGKNITQKETKIKKIKNDLARKILTINML